MNGGENATAWVLRQLLDLVVLVFASWTLYCYVLGLLGADYRLLFAMTFLPIALAVWVFFRSPKQTSEPATKPQPHSATLARLVIGGFAAAGVVGVYLYTGNYVVFWILTVIMLALNLRLRIQQSSAQLTEILPERMGVVVLLCLVAVTVTLIAHRPDADDSLYLSLVVGALDHPEQAILSCDNMYGEADLPLLESAYRLKSYELLVASLRHWSGIPVKLLYYLFFPSLFAVLVVAAHWLALREIGGQYAWLGAAVVVLSLIIWGDGNPTFGNFAFVRLFQGKAVLVSVLVPATVYYASRFARDRTWRNWLFLAAIQTAAIGISPSAIVVVPLAGAAYLLAVAPDTRGFKLIGEGFLASGLVVVAGLAAFVAMPIEENPPASIAAAWDLCNNAGTGLDTVLGLPERKALALFALLFVALLASQQGKGRVLSRYVLVLVVMIMIPLLPGALGIVTERLTWRVFWAVPFPLFLGLLTQQIAASGTPRQHAYRVGAAMVGVLFALTPGNWTLSAKNGTRLDFPGFKVDPGHRVAQSIVDQTDPKDLVLAPPEIAQWLPSFSMHPRLVAVRPHYFHVFSKTNWNEGQERKTLMHLVTYDWFPKSQLKIVVAAMRNRGVSLVVFPSEIRLRDSIAAAFEDAGYCPIVLANPEGVRSYEAWRRLEP